MTARKEKLVTDNDLSLADRAYVRLRRDILEGIFEPGQPLRLEALKERYGLSFSPIREALTRLSADKLAVLSSLKGFRVAPVSLSEMWDLISTRILVETEALRRSIERGSDQWEASVVAAFHALSRSAQRIAEDAATHETLELRHSEFHASLISACDSPSLLHIASQLYIQSERYRRPTLVHRPGAEERYQRDVMREHQAIMAFTIDRQPDKAVTLLTEHYKKTGRSIESALKQAGSPLQKRRSAVE
jgi:GntR family transcriptional regulator, carbon starvation induced regulator